jgi:hypothetical protein
MFTWWDSNKEKVDIKYEQLPLLFQISVLSRVNHKNLMNLLADPMLRLSVPAENMAALLRICP